MDDLSVGSDAVDDQGATGEFVLVMLSCFTVLNVSHLLILLIFIQTSPSRELKDS
jgi:hypothetical protein